MRNKSNFMVIRLGRQAMRIGLSLLACYLWLSPALAKAVAPAQAGDATTDFTIANGIKTIHRRVTANEVVAVQIYFRGGTRNINEKNAGIETAMLEVIQQGSKNFPKSTLNRELSRMGTILDSAGSYDFSLIAMRCVRRNFDRSWQLLTD